MIGMIELRGLHLGNIARSPAESVRPDLWPDHAWVPALGCTGVGLVDLVSGEMYPIAGDNGSAYQWSALGLYTTNQGWVGIRNIFESAREVTVVALINPSSNQQASIAGVVSAVTSLSVSQFTIATNSTGDGLAFYTRDTSTGTSGARNNDLAVTSILSPRGDIVAATYSVSRQEKQLWCDGRMVGRTTVSIDPITTGHSGTWIANTGGYSEAYGYFGWVGAVLIYSGVALVPGQLLDLTADPLLPFRRRQPVYYSVPSGGEGPPESAETPAAMMMGI